MSKDGDETRPTAPSRGALAASTLRALRAGRGGDAPAADGRPSAAGSASEAPDGDQLGDLVADRPDRLVDHKPEAASDVETATSDEADVEARRQTPAASSARRGRLITAACAALTTAALIFAVIAGVVWWTAGHSQQDRLGVARDEVSTDAQLAITTVNTSDYRHPARSLSNWLSVSTGSLHSQFSQSKSAAVKLLGEARTVAKADVLAEAVTSIDLGKGTASVLASVNLTRLHDGSSSIVRNRYRATMTRVGDQWKLSNLTVVAVSLS